MCENYVVGVAMDSVNDEEDRMMEHEKELMNDQNVFLYKLCSPCCLSQYQHQYTSYH